MGLFAYCTYLADDKYLTLQQEDLTALGKLILALACRSLIAVQRDNITTSVDFMARTYSTDLRNLVV